MKRTPLRPSIKPIARYTPLRRKPNLDPTREFRDKTTGELRLILSDPDWKAMKRRMWREGRGKLSCGICEKRIRRYRDLEPDHVKPRGMNGGFRQDAPENIQPSHGWCNSEKGSQRNFRLEGN